MPTRKRADTAQKKGGSHSVNSKIGTSATSHHAVNGQETTPPVASRHAKRKHADEHDRALARSPKRAHLEYGKPTRHAAATTTRAPLPAINRAPTEALAVLVFGNGDAGELGLGPTVQEATRPCVNPFLDPDNPSAHRVVQLACGGMHTVALTQDNRIVTWGVNDNGALGRSTEWEGALHDIDDEEEGELNPFESTPTSIPTGCFPRGTKFVQVAAGDSCSFALTDTGLVYGWGTFKDPQGNKRFGHDASGPIITRQATPRLIHGLSNITQIACGANHALALDVKGVIWTWGCGEQNQLGRHLSGRYDTDSYTPGPVNIRNIKHIGCGDYHSLAVDRKGQVWAWGLNSFGQAGHAKGAGTEPVLPYPMKIPSLRSKNVVCLDGGAHHSAAVTADGHCFVWGRLDSGQLGIAFNSEQLQDPTLIRYDARDKPRICLRPTPVRGLEVRHVACGSDHTIFITKAGAAYASGFNAQGQLGLGGDDDVVEVAQPIRGKALKDRVLVWACAGGQFSVIAARSESKPGAPAADGAAAS